MLTEPAPFFAPGGGNTIPMGPVGAFFSAFRMGALLSLISDLSTLRRPPFLKPSIEPRRAFGLGAAGALLGPGGGGGGLPPEASAARTMRVETNLWEEAAGPWVQRAAWAGPYS